MVKFPWGISGDLVMEIWFWEFHGEFHGNHHGKIFMGISPIMGISWKSSLELKLLSFVMASLSLSDAWMVQPRLR
jgi:hypothetical protein